MAHKKKTKQKRRLRRWSKRVALVSLGFAALSVILVLPLRWFEPVTTAFMLQDDSGVDPLRHAWVAWDNLGTTAALAMVASEDQRFADHFGLDLAAILKAVDEKSERGYLRGGSTISQQTAKNLFLWRGRSFVRKGLEAWIVTQIARLRRKGWMTLIDPG